MSSRKFDQALHVLNGERGQSLVQVLISAGIMSVLLAAFATMNVNQSREAAALAQKMGATDLQNAMATALANGQVCNYILNNPAPLTFNSNNVVAGKTEIITPKPQAIYASVKPMGPIIAEVGKAVSPYAPATKIQSIQLEISGAPASPPPNGPGAIFKGNWVAKMDQTTLVRVIPDPAVGVQLTVDTTKPGAAKITACEETGNNCWVKDANGLYTTNCGNVGIGTTKPGAKLHVDQGLVVDSIDNSWGGYVGSTYSNDPNHYTVFMGLRNRGTETGPPAYPLNNDYISGFGGRDVIDAGDPNAYGGGAILFQAAENFNKNAKGTRIMFETTPKGQKLPVPNVVIDDAGNVGIGTLSPTAKLEVSGGIRPGGATVGSGCAAEGTFAYDYGAHSLVYCNASRKWAQVAGSQCYGQGGALVAVFPVGQSDAYCKTMANSACGMAPNCSVDKRTFVVGYCSYSGPNIGCSTSCTWSCH